MVMKMEKTTLSIEIDHEVDSVDELDLQLKLNLLLIIMKMLCPERFTTQDISLIEVNESVTWSISS